MYIEKEKHSLTSFRVCSSKARWAKLVYHLKPTQPVVLCGVRHEKLRPLLNRVATVVKQKLHTSLSFLISWVGVKNFGFTEKQKNIEQGSIKLKELHVCIMRVQRRWRVFKRRWRLDGRKCRKMPESDICVCRKAQVVELHIVCMLK